MTGWIKLRRSLKEWEWYDDHNATRLLIHLLVSVNYEEKRWKGIVIPAGSMVLSWDHLSKDVGLSVQRCRTAMRKLENSGEITRIATNKYQMVSLVKWDKIQIEDKDANRLSTNNQQSTNNQVTTTKEGKKVKELKERETEFKNSLLPFVDKYGRDMINAFYLYWTEKKPRGKKMRFEMEKVFDISRRLTSWSNKSWNKKQENGSGKRNAGQIIKEKYGID